jgi:hypothetical protein
MDSILTLFLFCLSLIAETDQQPTTEKEELKKLHELYYQEGIGHEEFDAMKAEIVKKYINQN